MPRLVPLIALILVLCVPGQASAGSLEVTLHAISAEGVGDPIGSVKVHDSDQGLVITPSGAEALTVHAQRLAAAPVDGMARILDFGDVVDAFYLVY